MICYRALLFIFALLFTASLVAMEKTEKNCSVDATTKEHPLLMVIKQVSLSTTSKEDWALQRALELIGRGDGINNFDKFGTSLLHVAARLGLIEIVAVLLAPEKGVSINQQEKFGITPLMAAIWNKKEAVAELLIKCGAVLTLVDEDQNTALHLAALKNLSSTVSLLLKQPSAPTFINQKNKNGETPLLIALNAGSLDIALDLIEYGADVTLADKNGDTPLHALVKNGPAGLVAQKLIEKKSCMLFQQNALLSAMEDLSPLVSKKEIITVDYDIFEYYASAQEVFSQMVALLLERGAQINARNNDGTTPLLAAVNEGDEDAARELIEAEADVTLADNHGVTPLHAADREDLADTVLLLADKGGNQAQREAFLKAKAPNKAP